MGKKDIITKEYIEAPEVFADPFNYLLYGGKQVIDPKKLRPLDTTLVATPPYGADGAVLPVKRVRDGLKCLAAMEDDGSAYLLLGIENQSEVHYSMPVRDMLYDALQYVKQVEEAIRSRKKNKNSDMKISSGEYLSGFHKDDKLVPVITLVLYFGSKKWDAPMSLHEMLAVQDEKILSFVPDYRINLIAPAEMTDKKIKKLSTDLREVLLAIKYEKNIKKLFEYVNHDVRFRNISRQAAQVINIMLGAKLKINQEEERCDMKESLREWEERMRKEGHREGVELGRREETVSMVMRLLEQKKLTYIEIAEVSGLSVEEVEKLDRKRIA